MQQRVIKIILPSALKKTALDLLETREKIFYWLEESNKSNTVISVLAGSGLTETIMDIFEKKIWQRLEYSETKKAGGNHRPLYRQFQL